MLDENILERRLLNLEKAVSALESKVEGKSLENWLEQLIGSVSDEEAFLEALEYGRAFRKSGKLTDKVLKGS
ncbi:transferase hexapeptide repeat containing protein [Calothrix sp. CCY 0018]|uniref:transferase hexapeptide repeat containing protein n=1 Tax=Calothrix sp. CCY 0018 TaxID=3103864 RepID=UPI0039C689CA